MDKPLSYMALRFHHACLQQAPDDAARFGLLQNNPEALYDLKRHSLNSFVDEDCRSLLYFIERRVNVFGPEVDLDPACQIHQRQKAQELWLELLRQPAGPWILPKIEELARLLELREA